MRRSRWDSPAVAALGIAAWLVASGAMRPAAAQAPTAAPAPTATPPAPGPEDAARLEKALAEVAQARAGLKTMVGPFTQSRTIGLLAAKVRSSGTMTLVRPDRLRWELAPPDEVTYWVAPEGLAYRSKSGSGMVRGNDPKLAPGLSDLRIMLGGDLAQLQGRYVLTVAGDPSGPLTFDATPRLDAAGAASHLTFTLGPDRVSPLSAILVEGPRDRTEITFGALQKNIPVDPARVRP